MSRAIRSRHELFMCFVHLIPAMGRFHMGLNRREGGADTRGHQCRGTGGGDGLGIGAHQGVAKGKRSLLIGSDLNYQK